MKGFWSSALLVGLLGCGRAGFELTAPSSLAMTVGMTGRVDVTVNRASGFGGDVTLSLSSAPPGVSAQALTLHGSERTGSLALTISPAAAIGGPFEIRVEGRSGSVTRHVTLDLLVRGPAGTFDPRFGAGGTVVRELGPGSHSIVQAVALQADGKIVVTGRTYVDNSQILLARFTPAGVIDPTFGQGGIVTTSFCNQGDVRAAALVIQADGRIVVAGDTNCSGTIAELALARYLPDGSLDASFGTAGTGLVTTAFGNDLAMGRALLLQPDGKLVVGGSILVPPPDPSTPEHELFALARYAPDGTLDPGFGTGGKVTLAFQDGLVGKLYALALQPDGKIVAAGAGGFLHETALARFGPDGQVDTGFGSGGEVLTPIDALSEAYAVLLQPDGRIVTGGTANDGTNNFNFALARYLPDGSLDPEFGVGGTSTLDFGSGNDFAYALLPMDDGRIVACGSASNGTSADFALARFLPNGHTDDTFGSFGKATSDFLGGDDLALGATAMPDGTLLLVGTVGPPSDPLRSFALASYWP